MDSCAGKLIRANHRVMGTYVQLMPRMVQRRMEEMESKAAESAKAAEAAALSQNTEATQSAVTSSASPLLPPLATDAIPGARGLFSGSDISGGVSESNTVSEVKLSAAAALTPVSEAANPSVVNDAGGGPSSMAGFPQPPVAGAQFHFDSSAPAFNPTSTSADIPVSTMAPAAAYVTENPPAAAAASGQK